MQVLDLVYSKVTTIDQVIRDIPENAEPDLVAMMKRTVVCIKHPVAFVLSCGPLDTEPKDVFLLI